MKIVGTAKMPVYPIPYEYHVGDTGHPKEPFYLAQMSPDGKFINFYSYWVFGDEPEFAFKFPVSYLNSMKNNLGVEL